MFPFGSGGVLSRWRERVFGDAFQCDWKKNIFPLVGIPLAFFGSASCRLHENLSIIVIDESHLVTNGSCD